MKTIHAISRKELKQRIDRKEDIQIVNVLSPDYYHLGMIKGSRKIPLGELDVRFTELDKSREVIVYCANKTCDASHKAAEKLAELGFNVTAYEGGIEEWKQAKYPCE